MSNSGHNFEIDPATLLAIRELISKYANVRLDKLMPDTCLVSDLGIDGDDAFELLEEYAKRFNVNFEGFEFSDYFGGEGIDALAFFIVIAKRAIEYVYRRISPRPIVPRKDIDISHLARCAMVGHWFQSTAVEKPRRPRTIIHMILIVVFATPLFIMGGLIAASPIFLVVLSGMAFSSSDPSSGDHWLLLALLAASLVALWYRFVSRRVLQGVK